MTKFSIRKDGSFHYKKFPLLSSNLSHRLDGYIFIKSIYTQQQVLSFFTFRNSYYSDINQIKSLNHKIMKSKKTSKYYVDKDII